MVIDLNAATRFMTSHACLLDRRRLSYLSGTSSAEVVLASLDAYRNPDGGYGSGLEPDLRARESQPGGALHALEVFAEMAPHVSGRAVELCAWLDAASRPDGGLPFALPVADGEACAPFWLSADPDRSSLHITAAVTSLALRVASFDRAVADHPWLARARAFCLDGIRAATAPMHALELKYAIQFVDALAATGAVPAAEVARLASMLPPDGRLHVGGGLEDEFLGPLDFVPAPEHVLRPRFDHAIVEEALDRLEAAQCDDGGWPSEWAAYSPMAALEWRGWLTVRAISVLRAFGRT